MSEFSELLLKIARAETKSSAHPGTAEQIKVVLEENGLDQDNCVPPWLLHFFKALSNKQPLPVTELPATQSGQGEVWELFSSLQKIDAFDCLDYGEWTRIRLAEHAMLGLVSVEHSYYRVDRLHEIPDNQGDLSRAAHLARPD